MNLVFSLNQYYLLPLKVLLTSIFKTNLNRNFTVYLLHNTISENDLQNVRGITEASGHTFQSISMKGKLTGYTNWGVSRYYSVEMYFWLMAPFFLPKNVKRALYLDPDIICVGFLDKLYDDSLEGNLYKAANHEYMTKWLKPFNTLRLKTDYSDDYYNSGVVLMDIEKIRESSSVSEITKIIEKNKNKLILPDQDIFNLLFSDRIKEIDWMAYNLPPWVYELLKYLFPNQYNENWIENEVKLIHFMGKSKPWNERQEYKYQLGKYYFEAEEQAINLYPHFFPERNADLSNIKERKKDKDDKSF